MELEEIYEIVDKMKLPCIIPLMKTIKCKVKPTDVYAAIRKESNYSFLLESAIVGEKIARYSFLGFNPEKIIKTKNIETLRKELNYNVYANSELPPFFGGLVGYFPYDFVKTFENIGAECKKNAEFMFVKDLIVFDHWRDEIFLISNLIIKKESEISKNYEKARKIIEKLENLVKNSKPCKIKYNKRKVELKSNFSKKKFLEAVNKVKEYIYAGEIFQCVISQRFECSLVTNPFNAYLILRKINPSPYMYILEFGDLKILGSSPEILVKVTGKKVILRPIAGTRPRGRDAVEDEQLRRELLNDEKERAEHIMLVDLGRNDVSKVCKFGSVRVTDFMVIEEYSHVQHIVSNVVGELEENKDCFDAFLASFPAGTVTGAPKIRAMQIIQEIEPVERGIYAGAVGYFSFGSEMDFAIAIRTIIVEGNKAFVQAGAGIVADSIPEKEYEETVNKARALIKAIELGGWLR